MFCPRSKRNTPGFTSVMEMGFKVPVTRMGSAIAAAMMPRGAEASGADCHGGLLESRAGVPPAPAGKADGIFSDSLALTRELGRRDACPTLYTGLLQSPSSMRASYSSPSYSLLARIGPSVVSCQDWSLTISLTEPSLNSMRRFSSTFGQPKLTVPA